MSVSHLVSARSHHKFRVHFQERGTTTVATGLDCGLYAPSDGGGGDRLRGVDLYLEVVVSSMSLLHDTVCTSRQ